MKTKKMQGLLLIVATMIVLTSGCVAIYPVESFFRSPDLVRGVVLDQDDNPVSGATIVFEEWEYVPYVPPFIYCTAAMDFSRTREAITDDSGAFELSFKRKGLHLETIEKTGFVLEPWVTPKSWIRRNIPEQRNLPQNGKFLLYRVSNIDTSCIKTTSSPEFKFTTDGADYYLDLVSGKITSEATEGADLMFSVKEVGSDTWLVTILSIDGGIWASSNEMPYAPKGDYVSGFSTLYSQGYAISYRVQYDFFAKTQGGRHYSRIIADLIKEDQTIQFHWVLNQAGNRFLFVTESIDNRGIHGPPYCIERTYCNFYNIILGEGMPWWRKQEHNFYPILPETTFMTLADPDDKDESSRRYVARQLYAPATILDKLSQSTVWQERCDVAENPATPKDILKRLSSDPEEFVRLQANETLEYNYGIEAFFNSKGYSQKSSSK